MITRGERRRRKMRRREKEMGDDKERGEAVCWLVDWIWLCRGWMEGKLIEQG